MTQHVTHVSLLLFQFLKNLCVHLHNACADPAQSKGLIDTFMKLSLACSRVNGSKFSFHLDRVLPPGRSQQTVCIAFVGSNAYRSSPAPMIQYGFGPRYSMPPGTHRFALEILDRPHTTLLS